MKTVLVTSGGTIEKIDSVRSITNSGTGKLGNLIAQTFAKNKEIEKVFYVHAKTAVCPPPNDKITMISIASVADLEKVVIDIFDAYKIDIIIHSMAVSDYRVRCVVSTDMVLEAAKAAENAEAFLSALSALDIRKSTKKLSSQMESPFLLLEKTPKILSMFRKLAPESIIVGFKLLNQVEKEKLIDTAFQLLIRNHCNYVLANDAAEITANGHKGYLVDQDRNVISRDTKQEIATAILETILA